MVISYAFGWLKSMRWWRTWRHGEKREKVFVKNSSLVTLGFNTLTIKTLQCDELHFQLVTLIITTCRNVKTFGRERAEMAGCDEFRNQLVTSYQADIQRVKPHCDEWRVFNKTFLVLKSTNISKKDYQKSTSGKNKQKTYLSKSEKGVNGNGFICFTYKRQYERICTVSKKQQPRNIKKTLRAAERASFNIQKDTFHTAKRHISHCKRAPFRRQKDSF